MKRVFAVLLTGALTFGLAFSAFAAESAEAEAEVEVNASDVEAADDTITISPVYEETDAEAYEASVALAAEDDNATLEELASVDGESYELAYLFDATSTDGDATTLSIYVEIDSDTYYVLHYNGEAWELVDSEYDSETGLLTITTTTGFSPFAIYVEASTSSTTTTTSDDDTTSPTTGESSMMLYLAIIAVLAAAGLAVSAKLRRE